MILIVYIFNVYILAQSIKYWKEIEQKKLQRLDLYSERKGDSFSVSFSAFSYFKKRMCFLIRKQNQHGSSFKNQSSYFRMDETLTKKAYQR